jgi:hypothetical protein
MAITLGRTQSCADFASGGIVRLALANRLEIASVTVVSETITAFTMASTKYFHNFVFQRETLVWNETVTLENNSILVEGTISGVWTGWSNTDRTRLKEIAQASRCGMVAVFELEEGDIIVAGINVEKPTATEKYFLELNTATFNSGTLFSDAAQRTIELGYRSSAQACKFDAAWSTVPFPP